MVQTELMGNTNVCMPDERSGNERSWRHFKSTERISYHIDYLTQLIEKGGPDTDDYYELEACIEEINSQV